jgi:hypothetical protein
MVVRTVHVRVNDADTGLPTPVRIRFVDAEGRYLAPWGRLCEFPTGPNEAVGGNLLLGARKYAYTDGTCEIQLSPGTIGVEIHKGSEYEPQHLQVVLGTGQAALRFTVRRWIDLRADGWYSADSRAHFLTPHDAIVEGAAEDLHVVNLLAREFPCQGPEGWELEAKDPESDQTEDGRSCDPWPLTANPGVIPNILAFSGQHPALERQGCIVVVNTHNWHPVLGSLGLLNCHRVVYPLSFGGRNGRADRRLADWCDQCHRKGGLVVWTETRGDAGRFAYGEPLADLILGKVDAFEITGEWSISDSVERWYSLLNAGLRVPLVGGSGKTSNRTALGMMRTYARLTPGQELSYATWVEAVRSGRTFVTNGPLLSLTVDGKDPGTIFNLPSATSRLPVRVQARSQLPFKRLELLANGTVIAGSDASGSPSSASIETDWTPGTGDWLAARCWGASNQPGTQQRAYAHTSPIYVAHVGKQAPADASAAAKLVNELDKMLEWVYRAGRFEHHEQREQLADIFRRARQRLL